jgi:hypothetical protein
VIGKISKHKSFVTITRLVLEKLGGKIIGGNMYGEDVFTLVREFMVSRNLASSVKSPCYHLVISGFGCDLSSDEGVEIATRHFACVVILSQLKGDAAKTEAEDKRLSDSLLLQLVDKFIDKELAAYDYFIAKEPNGDVIHIVASRINFVTGRAIATWKDKQHSLRSVGLLEKYRSL